MAPRSGWPKPLAGWQTLCCVQIQGMTAGWIAAIRADSSCLDGKPRNSNSNKSKHWQKRKNSIMSIILRALWRGRGRVKQEFEAEFRPIFVTFTTGRSAEPTPFFYTKRDLDNLASAARRIVEVATARTDDRLLSTLPFAPHLAFWL